MIKDKDITIDYESSFYSGDSAGRKINPTTKKADLKDSDYKFALNSGLKFICPEELFVDSKTKKNYNDALPDLRSYQKVIQELKEC